MAHEVDRKQVRTKVHCNTQISEGVQSQTSEDISLVFILQL